MSSLHVLISLAGEVALLLWGIKLVGQGVQNGFGGSLRRLLAARLGNRFMAMVAGLLVTAALQSSTATAMMLASFSAAGLVAVVPALAVMLGANLGTALIAQAFSFDISTVFPLLLLVGYFLQRRQSWRAIELGRICLGLGVMLLSLFLLSQTVSPLETAPSVREVVRLVVQDPLLALMLAAVFTWAAHSSIAAILFIMSLAGAGVLGPEATVAMVLGANLGSAVNPVVEGTHGDPARLRVPVGNLFNRLVGCIVFLPATGVLVEFHQWLGISASRLAPDFHLFFNLAMALAVVGFLPVQARLLETLLPDRARQGDPNAPRYLDEASAGSPRVALANAAREVLRMADVAETMLKGSRDVFRDGDPRRVAEIRKTDDVVDSLYAALRQYLALVSRQDLDESEKRRLAEILAFAVNLEHIGDIVDNNLMQCAARRQQRNLTLPRSSIEQIEEMHLRLVAHLKLAVSVLMDGDAASARQLVVEKERFREFERAAGDHQMRQILAGRAEGAETSGMFLDIVRDLKRIESHIAATVYPLLERSGELRGSRLS